MIGDIDFILSKEDYFRSIIILKDNGYFPESTYDFKPFPTSRHFQRLIKKNKIGAIEIHSHLLDSKYFNEFNYSLIKKDSRIVNGINVLSYANKLNLSIISNQINDNGFYYKTINLRSGYDVFLLSKKTNALEAINTLDKLTFPLNCFLASLYETFNKPNSLKYHKSRKTESYLLDFKRQFSKPDKFKRRYERIRKFLIFKSTLNFCFKCIFNKEFRDLLLIRLKNRNWRKKKLIKFGIRR